MRSPQNQYKMKIVKLMTLAFVAAMLLASCGGSKNVVVYTPEESALGLVKVTNEANNSVIGPNVYDAPWKGLLNTSKQPMASSKEGKFSWSVRHRLSVSPDGLKIAHIAKMEDQFNVVIRNAFGTSTTMQRTFRDVRSVFWGPDDMLYFEDVNGINTYVCAVNAEQGSLVTQLTNGTVQDHDPVTLDGKTIFFTRSSDRGPSIWSINRETGTLTSCARGCQPCLIPGNPDAFYCMRNSSNGRSEIWYVDFVRGQETLVVSDEKRSYANPCLSPDGRWLVCEGNSVSTDKKKERNLDIYAVATDGSQVVQLTYNSSTDANPVFSPDGRYVYFISDRANDKKYYNIWQMHFTL